MIKEYRPLFIERWSKAEYINARLGITVIILTVLSLILTGTMIYLVTAPKPVYYIASMEPTGIVYPKQISDSSVSVFATSWVMNWNNFTPVTVVDVYERARKFMSPAYLAKINQRLVKDLEAIKANHMSSLFTLKEEPKVEKEADHYTVSIHGERGIYMGKETVSTQEMFYRISLKLVSPTDINPYGLMIDEIDQDVVRS